jgi:DNA-binding LacI/PurR family transcriptional regulator
MANIRDVAKKAGTSIATVSRVLSNDESFKVPDSTKENIFKAVRDLNYSISNKIKKDKRYRIGCIMAMTAVKYSDPYFMSMVSAIESETKKFDCNLSYLINYDELENPSKLEELYAMKLDGIIIMEMLPKHIIEGLKNHVKHIVTIDNFQNMFNSVGFDHFDSTKQVMKHLLSQNYKRIAYIGGGAPNIDMFDTKRLIMYRECLRRENIEYDASIIKDCYWDLDKCATQTNELLTLPNRPDVIFAGSDSLAQVVIAQIHKNNLRCPEDIAVVGFNNLNFSSYLIPPLTTVEVPSGEIGKVAVKRLMEMIQTKDTSIYSIFLPTKLVVRNSTRGI